MGQPPNNIGFVMPTLDFQPASPFQKPNQPSQPSQPPHAHQPFPAPIQHQVVAAGAPPSWLQTGEFANYLVGASSFQVKQKVELIEAVAGFETENKYTIYDERGNKIFHARESSDFCYRCCLFKSRPFTMSIRDARSGAEVLNFLRPIDCSCCCGAFNPNYIDARSGNGMKLGSVKQEFSLLSNLYKIKDSSGRTVLRIRGPWWTNTFCGEPVVFDIKTNEGVTIGSVKKVWGGFVREFITDADTFGISFPADLDPSIKAACLAALFLIDFNHFENAPQRR